LGKFGRRVSLGREDGDASGVGGRRLHRGVDPLLKVFDAVNDAPAEL
jgi:hypothetical protein